MQFLGVYFDAVPDEDDPKASRHFYQHFVSLEREYLPEPNVDVAAQFASWSQKLGRPALLPPYKHEVDFTRLVGLIGPCCVYAARTIICPDDREAFFVIGNTDPYRLYLNGEKIAEERDSAFWTPFNEIRAVSLKKGENKVLLKLLRRGDGFRFTFGVRDKPTDQTWRGWFNSHDWTIDLADTVPSPCE